jgi:hypothetical protein
MASGLSSPGYDCVIERRRAVALAHHFREAEGLSIAEIAEIAERLGRSPTTIKAYFYDPTGEKARAVKARTAVRGRRTRAPHAGEWPAASVVTRVFGTWSVARAVAARRAGEIQPTESVSASSSFGRESISLPKPRESAAISEDLRGGEPKPEPIDLQVLLTAPADFAHNSGR